MGNCRISLDFFFLLRHFFVSSSSFPRVLVAKTEFLCFLIAFCAISWELHLPFAMGGFLVHVFYPAQGLLSQGLWPRSFSVILV